jgi:hypothetical protein
MENPGEALGKMEPLLPCRPRRPLGCHNPRVPDRDAINAVLFVRTAGSSNGPRRAYSTSFGDAGYSPMIGLKGLDWSWLAMDGAMTKAPARPGKKPAQIPPIAPKTGPSGAC